MTKTAVYRHYDADDVLLYVGMSSDPAKRFQQHKSVSQWAGDVVRTEIDWYETRNEAFTAEGQNIRALNPAHNGNKGRTTNGMLSEELAGIDDLREIYETLSMVEEYAELMGVSPEYVCRQVTGDPRRYARMVRSALTLHRDLERVRKYMADNPVSGTEAAA